MPLQDYARNMGSMAELVSAPVNSLMQSRNAAEANQRRNALTAEAQRRTDLAEQNALQAQQGAQQKQQLEYLLAKVQWAKASGNPKAAILADPGIDPRAAQAFGAMSDEQVTQHLDQQEAQYASALGKGPPAPEKVGQLYPTAQGLLPAAQAQGKMPYQAPQRESQGAQGSWSAPFQAVGGDGKPGLFTQHSISGQVRPVSASGAGLAPPPKAATTSTVTVGPDGEMIVTQGKTNDVMRTASGFVSRMGAAEKKLGDYKPTTRDYIAATTVMTSGPVGASVANKVLSESGQRYYQAASDWVRAKLRKESGAVIGPEEMQQEIKTYFPVPGDSQEVITQKEQARAQATEALKTQAGGAFTPEAQPVSPATNAPKSGDNVKGYIFIGGDPSKQSNWVKAR